MSFFLKLNKNMSSITNEKENNLSGVLKNILPSTKSIDTLVGYFYFSGFQEIYKELADKKIRILVGMEIDKDVLNKISSVKIEDLDHHLKPHSSKSKIASKENYYNEFATVFNKTDWFDNDESIEAFKVFVDKIKDGSLEIKKTAANQHGKFYIFHYREEFSQGGLQPGMVISGSSNLTYSGLKGQGEHNLVLREVHYYNDHLSEFEKLWNDSENVVVADSENSEEFFKEIKSRIWLYAKPSPYYLYLRVLDEYFSVENKIELKTPNEITGGQYTDLQYQVDAIKLGIDRISKFNGVIVADVVGLGKSIIASAIAHNLGLRTVVIAPPHLIEQWNDYRIEFNFNADVFSIGKIEDAVNKYADSSKELLIILDEAHKHRNEDNESYKLLHRLCAGNKVLALSATPFNNDPRDIYALIKLFNTPGQSTLKTVENLSMEFHRLFAEYRTIRRDLRKDIKKNEDEINQRSAELALKLRTMIEPLVIRRSRLDLLAIDFYKKDLEKQGFSFAEVEKPKLLEYDLGGLAPLYIETLEKISPKNSDEGNGESNFLGVRYKPVSYLRKGSDFFEKYVENENPTDLQQNIGQAQINVAKFMRRLLVRRFESSVYAFGKSLEKMISSSEKMLEWIEKRGEVPVLKKGHIPEVEEFEDLNEDEIEVILGGLEEKGMIRIPVSELEPTFEIHLKQDIQLLKNIKKEWFESEREYLDPKFEKFYEEISKLISENKERKIIVFSEFSDTADYLCNKLGEKNFSRVFKYSSEDSSSANKKIIRINFDAGFPKDQQEDNFDILIATDAISEGYNLHRAGVIFNYDIPYNPTRVIQRVGRINRINKKVFDKLYIYNCFPTITGENEIKSRAISSLKMNLIHNLMGEDVRYLNPDEELYNYFANQYEKEIGNSETKSWDSEHRNAWQNAKNNQDLMDIVLNIPHRARIGRKSLDDGRQIVSFGRRGSSYIFAKGNGVGDVDFVSPEEAMNLFVASEDEKSVDTTLNFDGVYQKIKKHIFKNNTHPKMETGSRRFEVCAKLDTLSEIYAPAKSWCYDVIKIIKDYDALPEGLLKDLSKIEVQKNPEGAYEEYKKMLPGSYIKNIFEMAELAESEDELIVLSEEFL